MYVILLVKMKRGLANEGKGNCCCNQIYGIFLPNPEHSQRSEWARAGFVITRLTRPCSDWQRRVWGLSCCGLFYVLCQPFTRRGPPNGENARHPDPQLADSAFSGGKWIPVHSLLANLTSNSSLRQGDQNPAQLAKLWLERLAGQLYKK